MKNIFWMVVVALLISACGKAQKTVVTAPERPAFTFVVGAQGVDVSNIYSGEIRARYETVLGFRVGGKVVERDQLGSTEFTASDLRPGVYFWRVRATASSGLRSPE